jgi:hypothetical protein
MKECEKVVFDEIEKQLTRQPKGFRAKMHPLVVIAKTFIRELEKAYN